MQEQRLSSIWKLRFKDDHFIWNFNFTIMVTSLYHGLQTATNLVQMLTIYWEINLFKDNCQYQKGHRFQLCLTWYIAEFFPPTFVQSYANTSRETYYYKTKMVKSKLNSLFDDFSRCNKYQIAYICPTFPVQFTTFFYLKHHSILS